MSVESNTSLEPSYDVCEVRYEDFLESKNFRFSDDLLREIGSGLPAIESSKLGVRLEVLYDSLEHLVCVNTVNDMCSEMFHTWWTQLATRHTR